MCFAALTQVKRLFLYQNYLFNANFAFLLFSTEYSAIKTHDVFDGFTISLNFNQLVSHVHFAALFVVQLCLETVMNYITVE